MLYGGRIMNLNTELAEKIVKKTMNVLGKNINIMNSRGIIIGSGDKERLNTFHEIAGKAIEKQKPIIIEKEKSKEFHGVKEGINLPIVFNKSVIGVVGITGKVKEVSDYGQLVKNMVELMLQQEFLRNEIEINHRAKENFYQQILDKNSKNTELLEDRLKLFDIENYLKRVVFVISFETFATKLVTNCLNDLNNLEFLKKDDIFLIRGDKLLLIKTLRDSSVKSKKAYIMKLANKLKTKIKTMINEPQIGIGSIVDNINNLSLSYRDALFALEIGDSLNDNKEEKVYSINNLGFNYILPFIEESHAKKFLDNIFDKKTYKSYFDNSNIGEIIESLVKNNLNISKTADDLYIHRNTLLYQLNKIKGETGYNLKNASDLFTLLLAYHLYLFDH